MSRSCIVLLSLAVIMAALLSLPSQAQPPGVVEGLLSFTAVGPPPPPPDTTPPSLLIAPYPPGYVVKEGTEIGLCFHSSETLKLTEPYDPKMKVNGNDADYSHNTGLDYYFTYTIGQSDPEGMATVTAEGYDLAGNKGTATLNNAFRIDKTPPSIGSLCAVPTYAKEGTQVIITFWASETLSEANTVVTVNGVPATLACSGEMCNNYHDIYVYNYAYSYTVDASDPEGWATVTITARDLAGNTNDPPATSTSLLMIDRTPPSFSNIAANPQEASGVSSPVVITFDASEQLSANPTVTVNGNVASFYSTTGGDTPTYTYNYQVLCTDVPGPADIQVTGSDRAGNNGYASSNTALTIIGLDIADLDSLSDETNVRLTGKVVSLGSIEIGQDEYCIYLAEPIGSIYHTEGIKVITTEDEIEEEDGVTVIGELDTDEDGERVILASSVEVTSSYMALPIKSIYTLTDALDSVGCRVCVTGTVKSVDAINGYYIVDANNTPDDNQDDFKVIDSSPNSNNIGKTMFFVGVISLVGQDVPAVMPAFSSVNDVTAGNYGTPGFVGPAGLTYSQRTVFHTVDQPVGSSPYGIAGNGGLLLQDTLTSGSQDYSIFNGSWEKVRERVTANELHGPGVGEVLTNGLVGYYFEVDGEIDVSQLPIISGWTRYVNGNVDTRLMPNGYYQLSWLSLYSGSNNGQPVSGSYLEFFNLSCRNLLITPLQQDPEDLWGIKVVRNPNDPVYFRVSLSDSVYNDDTSVEVYIYPIPIQMSHPWLPLGADAAKTILVEGKGSSGEVLVQWNPWENNFEPGVYAYVVSANHFEPTWSAPSCEDHVLTAFRHPSYPSPSIWDVDASVGHLSEPGEPEGDPPYLPSGFIPVMFDVVSHGLFVHTGGIQSIVQTLESGPATVTLDYYISDLKFDASACQLLIFDSNGDRLYPTSGGQLSTARGGHTVNFDFYPTDEGKYYFLIYAEDSYAYCERGHRNKPTITNGDTAVYDGVTTWNQY